MIRLPLLDQLNLLHDERDIVLSGWSIARTGSDLFGNHFPLVFQNISPNNPLFAIYFAALWFLFVPIKSVFLARLPFVLISSLVVFLSFEIVRKITGDSKKSIVTAIILCFNPWIFHITRLALDIPLAIVFLFGGILLYLERKKLPALLLFFLLAFTYQGSRLLLPFLLIYLELFFFLQKKSWQSFLINSIINMLFIALLVVTATLIEPSISKNRLSEINFFNTQQNGPIVDFKRSTTIAPLFISRLLDNKLTVPIDEVVANFTKGLDPNYLFKNGDYSAINGNAVTGQFFFIFIIFYFLGIVSLGRGGSLKDYYLLGLIPLGMIPALLSTNGLSFSIRGVLSSIGFSYLITLGVLFSYSYIQKSKFRYYFLVCTILLLSINLTYFTYGYFFRRPITVGEMFNENERQLYLYLAKNNPNTTIFHNSPQDMLLSYIFFKQDPDMRTLQHNLNLKLYTFTGITLIQCNGMINYLKLTKSIIHEACLDKKTYDILNDIHNKKVKDRIPYHDFSLKTAYFVLK